MLSLAPNDLDPPTENAPDSKSDSIRLHTRLRHRTFLLSPGGYEDLRWLLSGVRSSGDLVGRIVEFKDPEIIQEFVVESTEHFADIESQLLTIEAAGSDIDVDLVNTVFRGVHSVKGAAGFLGLTSINQLAHSLENVLNLMRERELIPSSGIIDVMLQSADQLQSLLGNVSESNGVDVSDQVALLDAIASGSAGSEAVEAQQVSEPGSELDATDSLAAAEQLIAAMEASGATCVQEMKALDGDLKQNKADTERNQDSASAPRVPSPQPAAEPASKEAPSATQSSDPSVPVAKASVESSIRVSVESLDRLMNLAGELVLGRNQLLQTVASGEEGGLEAVAAKINQVTAEMQDAIMQTRMQPIGNVFTRFTRVVRDLSAKLEKQCRLVIEGKEGRSRQDDRGSHRGSADAPDSQRRRSRPGVT